MRRASQLFSLGTALALLPAAAVAMGFGRTATATTIGQPLDFIAQLAVDDDDEAVARECVAARVMSGDNHLTPENVRVELESARETGMRAIRVRTRTAIDEPVVTIDVTVGCRSQMTRRFVAFIDPPVLRLASAEPAESIAPQRFESQATPLVDIANSGGRARGAARGAGTGRDDEFDVGRGTPRNGPAVRIAAATPSDGVARAARTGAARKAARSSLATAREPTTARTAPRLKLDAAPALAAVSSARVDAAPAAPPANTPAPAIAASQAASAKDSATASSLAAAAAALEAASAALARERALIVELEAGVARLRSDSAAQQKMIGALQARLRQAEGDRYLNGFVYSLAAAAVFFALLAAAFWALRARQRRVRQWFDSQVSEHSRTAALARASVSSARADTPAISQPPSNWAESGPAILPVTAPAAIGGLEVTTVLAPQPHYAGTAEDRPSANSPPAVATRGAAPSVDALIDLEQQAEFYAVLGQEEAAIALLTSHLSDIGSASPVPFLHLLEIHRRRGDRASYEAVREEYGDRFDASAPEWGSDPHAGRPLAEHPHVVARLQALWPTPAHAMRALEGLLLRREQGDDAFELPAYRELLFLYSVARDLVAHVETDFGAIDLFLPLDQSPPEAASRHEGHPTVDLDLPVWPDESQPEGSAIRRSAGARGAG